MLTSAAPTILSVPTDSAWVLILGVSFVTFVLALVLRRLIGRPGGIASGIFLSLPLVVPLLAAFVFPGSVLPEVAVLEPTGRALLRGSGELMNLLLVDPETGVVTPYALSRSAGSWLLLFGVSASSLMLLRRAVGAVLVRTLVARCTPLPAAVASELQPTLKRLATLSGLNRTPELMLLPEGTPGVFAVGARRGRILVSSGLLNGLDRLELEATLAHEIAHLESRDCQVLFGAGLLRDIVAWNPIAHLSYRRLVTDRELEADRRAAILTGEPLAVASSLLKVCEMVRGSGFRHRALVGFTKPGARISRRISNLLALADGRLAIAAPNRLLYLMAAAILVPIGLQAGARIASQESRGLAITWGTPASTPADAYDLDPLTTSIKAPEATGRAKKGVDDLRPRHYARLASGGTVRDKDVDKWFQAMDAWARQMKRPVVRVRWESRQDWTATPLFSALSWPVGIYSLERQPI